MLEDIKTQSVTTCPSVSSGGMFEGGVTIGIFGTKPALMELTELITCGWFRELLGILSFRSDLSRESHIEGNLRTSF